MKHYVYHHFIYALFGVRFHCALNFYLQITDIQLFLPFETYNQNDWIENSLCDTMSAFVLVARKQIGAYIWAFIFNTVPW